MGKVNTIDASKHKDHSMLCSGDSCARGCKTKVHDDIFRQNFVVSGFVEPEVCKGMVNSTADFYVILSDKKI